MIVNGLGRTKRAGRNGRTELLAYTYGGGEGSGAYERIAEKYCADDSAQCTFVEYVRLTVGCEYVSDSRGEYFSFETEEDAVLFLLEWS